MTRAFCILVPLLCLSACAGQRGAAAGSPANTSAAGWTEWRELTSTHFRLRTNLSASLAERASRELERLRTAVLAGAFAMEKDPPGRLQVILFRDTEGMVEFVDSRVNGYVTSTPAGPLLVSSGQDLEGSGQGRAKLLHELAHYLSSFVLLRQPLWFAEGLAEYLETVATSGGVVRLGAANLENVKILQRNGALPQPEMWAADEPGASARAFSAHFYASAWLWFHFLADRYPGRLNAFEGMLRRAEDPAESFATAFSNTKPGALDVELQGYLTAQKFAVRVETVIDSQVSVQTKPLRPADLHALRAELFLHSPARRTEAERKELAQWELEQALESDPHNVEATVLGVVYKKPQQRLQTARELVRTNPKDGRAWTLLANELDGDATSREERMSALEMAARLSPDDAVALNNLAWEKVTRGEPAVGLELAERAVRIAPWSPGMLDTYAAALFRVGRCREALVTQQRAIDLLHEDVAHSTRQELLGALMQYRAQCGEQ